MENVNPPSSEAKEDLEPQEPAPAEPSTAPSEPPAEPAPAAQPSTDPLEALSREELLDKAKGYRAAYNRVKPPKEEPQAPAPRQETPYLTKEDFYKSNEKKALNLAGQTDDDISEDIKSNWSNIVPFYTPRRGRETPEDILEDMKDAHAVWSRNNKPAKPADDPSAPLTASPKVRSEGGATPPPAKGKKFLGKSNSITDWYGKKE